MNIKILPLLASVAAITLTTAPLAIQSPAQAYPASRFSQELNLTAEQIAQMEQIRENIKSQMEAVLTPEQQQQIQTMRTEGRQQGRAMKSLNLSEAQRTQMREIHRSAREQMQNVLTEEQRQQLRELKESRWGQRGAEGRNRQR